MEVRVYVEIGRFIKVIVFSVCLVDDCVKWKIIIVFIFLMWKINDKER